LIPADPNASPILAMTPGWSSGMSTKSFDTTTPDFHAWLTAIRVDHADRLHGSRPAR
jgi:hypothetical protein